MSEASSLTQLAVSGFLGASCYKKGEKGVKKGPAGHSGPAQGLQDGQWHFH